MKYKPGREQWTKNQIKEKYSKTWTYSNTEKQSSSLHNALCRIQPLVLHQETKSPTNYAFQRPLNLIKVEFVSCIPKKPSPWFFFFLQGIQHIILLPISTYVVLSAFKELNLPTQLLLLKLIGMFIGQLKLDLQDISKQTNHKPKPICRC